jgi:hypothetical protein
MYEILYQYKLLILLINKNSKTIFSIFKRTIISIFCFNNTFRIVISIINAYTTLLYTNNIFMILYISTFNVGFTKDYF